MYVTFYKNYHVILAAFSCEDYFKDGTTDSGNYTIDPDGNGPNEPFVVFCNATERLYIYYAQHILS